MKEKHTGATKFRLDPQHLPGLDARQAARLRTAAIDTSEIPSQQEATWSRPGALVPSENKRQITLRLDADVVAFFRATGKRYQSRINAVLREYVKAHGK